MPVVQRFEDAEVWQAARQLGKAVYAPTGTGAFTKGFGLRDQIQRVAVSVMSNIAEGFERSTNKEFVYYLYVAKGSAGEVRSQLYVALDLGYLVKPMFDELSNIALSVIRQLSGFIRYLEGRPKPPESPI